MKRTYAIISESNDEKEILFTSTRKAEIEKDFRRWIKRFKKSEKHFVSQINCGYAIVTYMAEFSMVETEYYITSKIG